MILRFRMNLCPKRSGLCSFVEEIKKMNLPLLEFDPERWNTDEGGRKETTFPSLPDQGKLCQLSTRGPKNQGQNILKFEEKTFSRKITS